MTYAFENCEMTKIDLDNYPNHSYLITGMITIFMPGNNIFREKYSVRVKAPHLFKYHGGASMQDAFPYLSVKDREFLMSGTYREYDPSIEDGYSRIEEDEDRAVDQQINMIRGK
jgi:hypothetical protein